MSCSIFKLFISLYLLTEHLTWSGGRNMKNWKNFDIFQTSIFSPSPQEPRGKRRLEFTAWTDWCWTAGPSLTSRPAAPTLTRSSAGTSPSSPAGPPPSTAGSSTSATGRSVSWAEWSAPSPDCVINHCSWHPPQPDFQLLKLIYLEALRLQNGWNQLQECVTRRITRRNVKFIIHKMK